MAALKQPDESDACSDVRTDEIGETTMIDSTTDEQNSRLARWAPFVKVRRIGSPASDRIVGRKSMEDMSNQLPEGERDVPTTIRILGSKRFLRSEPHRAQVRIDSS
jgi:hypothetical protein